MVKIITESDFLLVPTMAEAAGIMFCEASAFGLPSFTHHVGGTPDYVVNGVNGYGFPLGTTAKEFADKIKECIRSGELDKMRATSRQFYEERLNWRKWSEEFKKICEEIDSKK